MTDLIARSYAAAALLRDETLQSAFDEVTADLMRDWRQSADDAAVKRENIWRMVKAMDRITNKLTAFAADCQVTPRSGA